MRHMQQVNKQAPPPFAVASQKLPILGQLPRVCVCVCQCLYVTRAVGLSEGYTALPGVKGQ